MCRVSRCLAKFGIYPSRTHGADGKLRFHSVNPINFMNGDPELAKYHYFTTEGVAIGNPEVRRLVPY